MTYLAFHNLFQQKFRLALSIVGVALAMMLILLLNGFQAGVYQQVTAYLDHTPADWVVAQDGVTNMLSATSLLPASTEDLARGVPGVAQAIPIVSRFVILDIHDRKVVAYLVGYDPAQGGGPWALKAGRLPADDDEVVLDWVMADLHGFSLGDTIEILDEEFRVAGLSDGTNSWMASFLFVDKRAAERLLRRIAKEQKRSVIIVSHDQRIKEIADRVLWLEDGQFKDMIEMALDPVCGMSVDKASAPAQALYDGQVLYFCAAGWRDEFLAAPERFWERTGQRGGAL